MTNAQAGILAGETKLARYLTFSLKSSSKAKNALVSLKSITDHENTLIGLGKSLILALGCKIDGLRTMQA
jgi:hypothetical protein